MSKQLDKIRKGVYFGNRSMAVFETTKQKVEPDADTHMQSSDEWSRWGEDNNYPQNIIDANMQDATSAGALRFKRNAHYGAGLYFYIIEDNGVRIDREAGFNVNKSKKRSIIEIPEEDLPEEVQEFIFNNDLPNFSQGIITDFEWWNMCHVGYMLDGTRNKIFGVDWQRAKNLRAKKKNDNGIIEGFFLSGDWYPQPHDKPKYIPALDKRNPFSNPYSIYKHTLPSVDRDYYITPEWHANMRFINLAAKIPEWILSNIENSINIKYHIHIPEEYFTSLYPRDRYDSDEDWYKVLEEKEQDLYDKIDKMLAGEKNASKTFYSKIAIDEQGNELPGWKIDPITNEIKDEAWLKAYGTGAAAICTAHGVPPSLAGLILSSGLGTGSASDVREQFNYYLQLNTVTPRQTTTEWWSFVSRFNGWNKIFSKLYGRQVHLGYRNIVLQSTDENKSGFATQNEPTPTTAEK
jgi:hypothetical protein